MIAGEEDVAASVGGYAKRGIVTDAPCAMHLDQIPCGIVEGDKRIRATGGSEIAGTEGSGAAEVSGDIGIADGIHGEGAAGVESEAASGDAPESVAIAVVFGQKGIGLR